MSLLLDALKRAEEAKRQRLEGQGASAEPTIEGLATVPPSATVRPNTELPPLPDRLELLDQEFFGEPSSPPTASSRQPYAAPERPAQSSQRKPLDAPSLAASPAAARVLFDAKQPATANRQFLIVVATLTALAIVAIGIYFWWQLRPKTAMPVSVVAHPVAAPAGTPSTSASTAPSLTPEPKPSIANHTAGDGAPMTSVASPALDIARGQPKRQTVAQSAPAPAAANDGIRFVATAARLDPNVGQAYALLQTGDTQGAQRGYLAALRNDPGNLDALHGLAVIAAQARDYELAASYYKKALALDPKDAIARAGLDSLMQADGSAPTAATSANHLRTALAEQPNSGPLQFALGNSLAAEGRWPEAQQAYFQAVTTDSDNPDYLFNLAVSLEHLRKNPLAAQYYQRAATTATRRAHGFDTALAVERAKALQP